MNSNIALIGGETTQKTFENVHIRLADLARSTPNSREDWPLRVVYLVSCAAHDGDERVDYLRERAQKTLGSLGLEVFTPRIIDHQSANDPDNACVVAEADWIYFSGGHPNVGMNILKESRVFQAIMNAYQRGVLISGSSAGAMILCSHSIIITPELNAEVEKIIRRGEGLSDWHISPPLIQKCLGMVPRSMCWPHMNVFFSAEWAQSLLQDGHRFIGVDEQTAAVKSGDGRWQVWGLGKVAVGSRQALHEYLPDEDIDL
jgi:cyanophycinase-like exopeptidase